MLYAFQIADSCCLFTGKYLWPSTQSKTQLITTMIMVTLITDVISLVYATNKKRTEVELLRAKAEAGDRSSLVHTSFVFDSRSWWVVCCASERSTWFLGVMQIFVFSSALRPFSFWTIKETAFPKYHWSRELALNNMRRLSNNNTKMQCCYPVSAKINL